MKTLIGFAYDRIGITHNRIELTHDRTVVTLKTIELTYMYDGLGWIVNNKVVAVCIVLTLCVNGSKY